MTRVLYTTHRLAEKIGSDNLRGYYRWSFTDNLEWNRGLTPQRFGAYAVENLGTPEAKIAKEPRPGIDPFVKMNKARQKNLAITP